MNSDNSATAVKDEDETPCQIPNSPPGPRAYLEAFSPQRLSNRVATFWGEIYRQGRIGKGEKHVVGDSFQMIYSSHLSGSETGQVGATQEKETRHEYASTHPPVLQSNKLTASVVGAIEQVEDLDNGAAMNEGRSTRYLRSGGNLDARNSSEEAVAKDPVLEKIPQHSDAMNSESSADAKRERPGIVAPERAKDGVYEEAAGEDVASTRPKTDTAASVKPTKGVVCHDDETGEPIFAVERIVQVRPVESLEVKLKWLGYDETTWEPMSNLTSDELIQVARQMLKKKVNGNAPPSKKEAKSTTNVTEQSDVLVDDAETAPSSDDAIPTAPVYEVERIEDVRPVDDWEVKIKWIGYSRMTWEPLYNLDSEELLKDARQMIDKKKSEHALSLKDTKRQRTGSQPARRSEAKRQRSTKQKSNSQELGRWKPERAVLPALSFGGLAIDDVKLGDPSKPKKQTLLSYCFGGGHNVVRFSTSLGNRDLPLQGVGAFNGANLVLAGLKVADCNSGFKFGRQKELRFFYVVNKESGAEHVQQKLENLADFRSLPVRKRILRLEHLLTDGEVFDHLLGCEFEQIDDVGQNGCGFIPIEMLRQMYPRRPWVSAMQVRVIIPQLGLAKGMLVGKKGISKIQVPSSMIKVLPPQNQTGVPLLLVRGVFPSTANRNFGLFLDHSSPIQPPKSFDRDIKTLSPMYSHLLEGLGVPAAVVKQYAKAARNKNSLEHATLVGVADPTGFLPPGKVFITGPTRNLAGERQEMLITRSPCLEPSDMKLLPVCESNDDLLSENSAVGDCRSVSRSEAWSELCNLPFGLMVFPLNQMLPDQIAEGDLDGDLYVIFWSSRILSNIRKTKNLCCDVTKLPPEPKLLKRDHSNGSSNWLEETHTEMMNLEKIRHQSELIGALFNKCQDVAKKSKNHAYDRDSMAFARACKDSIDSGKHSSKVRLPQRLHSELKERLHPLLEDCADK